MIRLKDPLDRPGRAREFRCTVHGLCFDNRYRLLDAIHAGDPLVLVREPDNAIGADAIQVVTERTETLGYVPRQISRWLAPVMDSGRLARAVVLKVRSGAPYYERLLIEVRVS
ncbi:MAG TPA: HIRAN domain-containing protein [Gemmatimonadota bacterium]|nr:HIRAN domain-containing protein [Gemmatimonadota bacterium]